MEQTREGTESVQEPGESSNLPATKKQAQDVVRSLDQHMQALVYNLPTLELTAFIVMLGAKKMRERIRGKALRELTRRAVDGPE